MHTLTRITLVASLLALAASAAFGQTPPPVELVPFVPATRISPRVQVSASFDPASGKTTYRYTLTSLASSQQKIGYMSLEIDSNHPSKVAFPKGWNYLPTYRSMLYNGAYTIDWVAAMNVMVLPGARLTGFSCTSSSLPDISVARLEGYVPLLTTTQNYEDPSKVLPESKNNVPVKTVAPKYQPASPFDPGAFLTHLEGLKDQAAALGWIDNQGVANSLDAKLENAGNKLANGQTNTAVNILQAFLDELGAQHGKHVDDNAYALLEPNAKYLINWLDPTALSGR